MSISSTCHPQGVLTLGTLYSSSLFPGRAPNGDMLILNYIGGAKNRNVVNQTNEQLAEQVRTVLLPHMGLLLGRRSTLINDLPGADVVYHRHTRCCKAETEGMSFLPLAAIHAT